MERLRYCGGTCTTCAAWPEGALGAKIWTLPDSFAGLTIITRGFSSVPVSAELPDRQVGFAGAMTGASGAVSSTAASSTAFGATKTSTWFGTSSKKTKGATGNTPGN